MLGLLAAVDSAVSPTQRQERTGVERERLWVERIGGPAEVHVAPDLVETGKAPALQSVARQLRATAALFEEDAQAFTFQDGQVVFRPVGGGLNHPIRRFGRKTVILGRKLPNTWTREMSGKVISIADGGMVVDFGGTWDMRLYWVANHPAEHGAIDGAHVSGVYLEPTKRTEYTTVLGARKVVPVLDHGQVLHGDEARAAADEWIRTAQRMAKAHVGRAEVLEQRATQLLAIEQAAASERRRSAGLDR